MVMKFQIEGDTRVLIEKVVAEHLDGHEIEPCQIVVDVDDDGSQSIEVGLCYKFSSHPVDPAKTLDMLSAITHALIASGDFRIPYVEHYFEHDQPIKGEQRAC